MLDYILSGIQYGRPILCIGCVSDLPIKCLYYLSIDRKLLKDFLVFLAVRVTSKEQHGSVTKNLAQKFNFRAFKGATKLFEVSFTAWLDKEKNKIETIS